MSKTGRYSSRQRIRAGALLLSLLLFPITMNSLSPYLIIDAASQGTVNASFLVFGLLFLSALAFFGRAWCGWACPAWNYREWMKGSLDSKIEKILSGIALS